MMTAQDKFEQIEEELEMLAQAVLDQ